MGGALRGAWERDKSGHGNGFGSGYGASSEQAHNATCNVHMPMKSAHHTQPNTTDNIAQTKKAILNQG